PPSQGREGLRGRDPALYRSGRLHPVRELRAGLSGDRDLHRGDDPREVEAVPADQRGLVQEPGGDLGYFPLSTFARNASVRASASFASAVRNTEGSLDDANAWPASG